MGLNLCGLLVEGDSKCVLIWASSFCRPPWRLLDVVEEVLDLAKLIDFFLREPIVLIRSGLSCQGGSHTMESISNKRYVLA